MFHKIAHSLNSLGFIKRHDGRNSCPNRLGVPIGDDGAKKTYFSLLATRLKPLASLIAKAAEYGLKEDIFHTDFFMVMPSNILEVRAAKKEVEKAGKEGR